MMAVTTRSCNVCPMQPSTITGDTIPSAVPSSSDYEMNFMMEPLDDIICGKESPFISPSTAPLRGTSVVQAHMTTNATWMNTHATTHSLHNHHHLQPMTHQIHQIKIHPQVPGTPPDTPPGFSPASGSLPPSPPFVPAQQTTAIVEEMWATSYNRYLEPLDLRHGPPQLYHDPLDQQPFYVDRQTYLQQRQTQLQMPLMPAKQQQHPHHHHHHHQQQILHQQQQQEQQQQQQQPPLTEHQAQLLAASHFEISDDELLSLTVRDLNKRLHSMTKEMQTQVKQRRRTLKNRGYAQSCRFKRQELKSQLEIDNSKLSDQLVMLKEQLKQKSEETVTLRKERDAFREENHMLRHHIHHHQQQPQPSQQQQQQQHHTQQQQQQQHQPVQGLLTPLQQASPQGIYDI